MDSEQAVDSCLADADGGEQPQQQQQQQAWDASRIFECGMRRCGASRPGPLGADLPD